MERLTLFLYEAIDPKRGIAVRGSWFAPTKEKALFWLEGQGLSQVSLKASSQTRESLRVRPDALALFYRQLGVLLQSGTALPLALQLVSFSDDQHLSGAVRMLESEVCSGLYLSASMAQFPLIFDPINVGLVTAGENSGKLAKTLLDIADAEERLLALRGKVISSLTYPIVLAGFTLTVTAVFLFYVLPLNNDLFGSLGVELPALNRALISLVDALKSPWLPVGLFLAVGAFMIWVNRKGSKKWLKERGLALLEKSPPIRRLLQKAHAVRTLQIINLQLTSGGTVDGAMKLMISVSEGAQKETLLKLRQRVLDGADFGAALEATGYFPPLVTALLRVGYETAQMDRMTVRAMEICEEDVSLGLDALASLIEPILLGFAGVFAAFIVISAAIPMIRVVEIL